MEARDLLRVTECKFLNHQPLTNAITILPSDYPSPVMEQNGWLINKWKNIWSWCSPKPRLVQRIVQLIS